MLLAAREDGTDVVGVFPNDAAIDRLVTAVIVEHDEWTVGKCRYLSETSMARLRQSATPTVGTAAKGRKRLAG